MSKKRKKKRKKDPPWKIAMQARREADAEYRRALGLEVDQPLPAMLGTANGAGSARGGRGGRSRREHPKFVS
jgi:hypothetical protein